VIGWRLAHLPVLLVASGLLLAAAAVAGWVLRGGTGAAGAALGVAVVVASYLLSTLVIAWADSVNPSLVLPFGLMAYIVKFTAIGFVLVAITATDWAGLPPMGVGVVAGVVTWTGTQIWWVVHQQRSRTSSTSADCGNGDVARP
jgi:uncharacterized membrane protein YesL